MSMLVSSCAVFFPRDVLDELLDLIGSVSNCFPTYSSIIFAYRTFDGKIESMMEMRPRQGNLRLVFRLVSLMRGLPSIRLK